VLRPESACYGSSPGKHTVMAFSTRRSPLDQQFALDSCDADDINEVIASVDQELARPNPNRNTLATYLSSLVRSLRSRPSAQEVSTRLDAAMRKAGLPTL
jgi:hypothetical protein